MSISAGAMRLKEIVELQSAAKVAETLECTRETIYNLMGGTHPSLTIALRAERTYYIPCHAWEDFDKKRASK